MNLKKSDIKNIITNKLSEMSISGGSASTTSGPGEQFMSKYAWKKLKPGKIKGAKGVIHKDLWKEMKIEGTLNELLNEVSSRAYSKSIAATPSQKSKNAFRLVRKKLQEIDQILEYSNKLKEEMNNSWNLNEQQRLFINEKMKSLSSKLKRLSK